MSLMTHRSRHITALVEDVMMSTLRRRKNSFLFLFIYLYLHTDILGSLTSIRLTLWTMTKICIQLMGCSGLFRTLPATVRVKDITKM